MANAYVQLDESRGYNGGIRKGIATNSTVIEQGDLVYKTGWFISKVSTGNKAIWVSVTEQTYASDNQTVALANLLFIPTYDDTRLKMTITWWTITQVDEWKYYTCDSSQRIDWTTESTLTGDYILDEFVSSTSGYFRVVPSVNAVSVTTWTFVSSWNTTIWDSSADALTINATTTALAPITVWVDWTGHDVTFFGATSWSKLLWDEGADDLIASWAAWVLVASPTGGGLWYTTGAWGAVTQGTNRSTWVTISKLSWTITTDTTPLAAEWTADFIVTNTTVAIWDVVVVAIQSWSNSGWTIVSVSTVAAGSFTIRVHNWNVASGTAETWAILINFAVIKAVSA